jgi:hypothetical protein
MRTGIAFTKAMMNPQPAGNGQYFFQKIIQELDYLAGGVLDLAPNGVKDLKPAKDNSYVRSRFSVVVFAFRSSLTVLSYIFATVDVLLSYGISFGCLSPYPSRHWKVSFLCFRSSFPALFVY